MSTQPSSYVIATDLLPGLKTRLYPWGDAYARMCPEHFSSFVRELSLNKAAVVVMAVKKTVAADFFGARGPKCKDAPTTKKAAQA